MRSVLVAASHVTVAPNSLAIVSIGKYSTPFIILGGTSNETSLITPVVILRTAIILLSIAAAIPIFP